MANRDEEKEEGRVLWECCRAPRLIVSVSLFLSFLSWVLIVTAWNESVPYRVAAGAAVLLLLCQIVWIHRPVAVVCEKALLLQTEERLGVLLVPWRSLIYVPVSYDMIVGVSDDWRSLYLGERADGGMVRLPVLLSYVSVRDKKKLIRYMEKLAKQEHSP